MKHLVRKLLPSAAADPRYRAVCRRFTAIVRAADRYRRIRVSAMTVFETVSRRQIPIWNKLEVSTCAAA